MPRTGNTRNPSFIDTPLPARLNYGATLHHGPVPRKDLFLTASQLLNLVILLFIAFGMNVPLGYLREGQRKFSVRWFVYIHLSIPIIIAARLTFGFGWGVVPLTLGCAVVGQLVGGQLNRRRAR
jgi:hypothetical protein